MGYKKLLKIKYLTVIVICTMFSCDIDKNNRHIDPDKENLVVKRTYYSDKTPLSEKTYKNDSLLHGWSKIFYQSGKLRSLIEYKNGNKDGVEKVYYPNGQIKYVGYNINGKADSICLWYYENGVLKSHDNWFEGIPFGYQIKFDSTGSMQEYFFNNIEGVTTFSRTYSPNGEFLDKGKLLYIVFNKDNIKVGETLELLIYPASPPNTHIDLAIETYDENNKLLHLKEIAEEQLDVFYYGKRYYHEAIFNASGDYIIKVKMNLRESGRSSKVTEDLVVIKCKVYSSL